MWTEEEFMDELSDTKNEIRNLKTLSLYFNYLQLKGETSLRVSHFTKEDYDEFKSHLHHWIDMDRKFQKFLEHYLNSPVLETSEELSSDKIKKDSSTSSQNCDISSSTSSNF